VPSYVKLKGGSVGFQIGVEGTDLVLFFLSDKAIDQASLSQVQLGAGASVAGGPVGRDAEGATNPTFRDKIVSYSRSRGVFAGVNVSGAAFLTDGTANASVFGNNPTPDAKTLLTTPRSQAKAPLTTGIDAFLDTLTKLRNDAVARQAAAGN
jgi:lipid-binding SYLF domain-containing protein